MYICYAITKDPHYKEICKQADELVNLYNKEFSIKKRKRKYKDPII